MNKESCCLSEIRDIIALHLKMRDSDLLELTNGGSITKHMSRVNYCASYLKKMKMIRSVKKGTYIITDRGKEVLSKYGKDLTLDSLRNEPEFIATQINKSNKDYVYVRPHIKGSKIINGYVCNKKELKSENPNIDLETTQSYRESLKDQ